MKAVAVVGNTAGELLATLHHLRDRVAEGGLLTGNGRVNEAKHDDDSSQCLVGDAVSTRMDPTGFVATDSNNPRSPFRTSKNPT